MKPLNSLNSSQLLELSKNIQTLPPDEAASLLFEGSVVILAAGFFDVAYQGFLKLTEGELKISQYSSLADFIPIIMPGLCYSMKIPCPSLFSEPAMSLNELETHIDEVQQQYEYSLFTEQWLQQEIPVDNWSDEFISGFTHPKTVVKNGTPELHQFLEDLQQLISQYYVQKDKWHEIPQWLKVFDAIVDAWEIDCQDYYVVSLTNQIFEFGTVIYLYLGDIESADKYLKKWWQCLNHGTDIDMDFMMSLTKVTERIATGVLQSEIQISHAQAQAFLAAVDNRNYVPVVGFVPQVKDWKQLLEQIGADLQSGATEEEISELEARLQTTLPVSYKNFLLATNGFMLNEYCEFYGTKQIKWFIEENEDLVNAWADAWGVSDDEDIDDENINEEYIDEDINDEAYFQYGEHQDPYALRVQYMKTALQISKEDDGGYVYLLNPKVIDARNEWEAWDFGNKIGAHRYRSFWDMMQKIDKSQYPN